MPYLVPWVVTYWFRLSRHHKEQLDASRRTETALGNILAPKVGEHRPANDHSADVEQNSGNCEHDDDVRMLKVAALHEFKPTTPEARATEHENKVRALFRTLHISGAPVTTDDLSKAVMFL